MEPVIKPVPANGKVGATRRPMHSHSPAFEAGYARSLEDLFATGKDLMCEGEQMLHCVGAYVNACASGVSRIFHLEHLSEVATLELRTYDGNTWKIRQVFGPRNDDASANIWKASKILAAKYTKAVKEKRLAKNATT